MKIAIIGGGAAGMFCAANIKNTGAQICVLESSNELLCKVKLSGGGRCNITNAEPNIARFIKSYPRGGGRLRKPFMRFGARELCEWFNARSVEFVTEAEGRIFPKSQSSMEIIDCIKNECVQNNVEIRKLFLVKNFDRTNGGNFKIESVSGENIFADIVLFACGGVWNIKLQNALEKLGHKFVSPCPSLFSFALNDKNFTRLSGLAFENAKITCPQFGLESEGAMLATHEGASGPAILKMSSLGAREFQKLNYNFEIKLSVVKSLQSFKDFCDFARRTSPKKFIKNVRHPEVPQKYWEYALEKIALAHDAQWAHFNAQNQKKLGEVLTENKLQVSGKAVNTQEFVTCGGVELDDIDFKTMQSKIVSNIFFAGECLNIDGFTGGYNLQAAWTTSYIAAREIEKIISES